MSKLEIGKTYTGYAVKAETSEVLGTDVVVAEVLLGSEKEEIVIPREELDIVPVGGPLFRYIGMNYPVDVISIDNDIVLGSIRSYKEEQRNKAMENKKEIEAKIIVLMDFGAYVEFDGITALLKNRDFSTDFTKVSDVMKRGDTIKVRVLSANNNKKILVEAVDKYEEKEKAPYEKISVGDYLIGKVNTIKTCGVFVRVGKGLDVLTSMPAVPELQVERNDEVVVHITKRIDEKQQLRGKIVKKIMMSQEDLEKMSVTE